LPVIDDVLSVALNICLFTNGDNNARVIDAKSAFTFTDLDAVIADK